MSIDEREWEGDDDNDNDLFRDRLRVALSSDLDAVEGSGCVCVSEVDGHCYVFFIPIVGMGFSHRDRRSQAELLHMMSLLYLKKTRVAASSGYTLIYGHSRFSVYSHIKMLRELYNMLPRCYKKNLKQLYVLHPTPGLRAFFHMSKAFIGRHGMHKIQFVGSIAGLQRLLPLAAWRHSLPASYLRWEDLELFNRSSLLSAPSPSLQESFDASLGAPWLVVRCAEHLRELGMQREGLFRVPGSQVSFEVAQIRIRAGQTSRLVIGGACVDESEQRTDLAALAIDDIDEVAQLFKVFLRDLPQPVVTTEAYKAMVLAVTESNREGDMSADEIVGLVEGVLERELPESHLSTLLYILRFLAEVAAQAHLNKMNPDNLSVVFAPTLMRVQMDDPMQAMSDIKTCQRILKALLLKNMEGAIRINLSDNMVDRLNR
mmetsp:Transcript_4983/g.7610  ORF Transcript_4983/g.7610 Transcript_4983/m.7610 type:complete len:430 (-) Transcript_4983:146-1435(-)